MACRWVVGTLELRVRSIASGAAVKIFAALLLVAPALVETSTNSRDGVVAVDGGVAV